MLLHQSKAYRYARSLPVKTTAVPKAAHRRSLHGKLVNQIMRKGAVKRVSYRAFQWWFGKSVGLFVEQLRRKAKSAGIVVNEFPTGTTKLSQTCHHCACGEEAQRGSCQGDMVGRGHAPPGGVEQNRTSKRRAFAWKFRVIPESEWVACVSLSEVTSGCGWCRVPNLGRDGR